MDPVEELANSLEPIVDKEGIARVLEALAYLCEAKKEHILSSWGDQALARSWGRVAGKVTQAARTAAPERL